LIHAPFTRYHKANLNTRDPIQSEPQLIKVQAGHNSWHIHGRAIGTDQASPAMA